MGAAPHASIDPANTRPLLQAPEDGGSGQLGARWPAAALPPESTTTAEANNQLGGQRLRQWLRGKRGRYWTGRVGRLAIVSRGLLSPVAWLNSLLSCPWMKCVSSLREVIIPYNAPRTVCFQGYANFNPETFKGREIKTI